MKSLANAGREDRHAVGGVGDEVDGREEATAAGVVGQRTQDAQRRTECRALSRASGERSDDHEGDSPRRRRSPRAPHRRRRAGRPAGWRVPLRDGRTPCRPGRPRWAAGRRSLRSRPRWVANTELVRRRGPGPKEQTGASSLAATSGASDQRPGARGGNDGQLGTQGGEHPGPADGGLRDGQYQTIPRATYHCEQPANTTAVGCVVNWTATPEQKAPRASPPTGAALVSTVIIDAGANGEFDRGGEGAGGGRLAMPCALGTCRDDPADVVRDEEQGAGEEEQRQRSTRTGRRPMRSETDPATSRVASSVTA